MKKTISLIIIAFCISGIANAQAFTKESFAANLGFGFGWYSYGYSVSSFPAITFSAEKGVWDVEDVGVISLGGTVGWKAAKYDWPFLNDKYEYKWTDFIVAARGTLHPQLIDNDKVDLYGGVALGVRFETYKYYLPNYNSEATEYTDNNANPLLGIYVGGRYYFSDHFGVFAELGYGLGYLTIGASYKIP